MQLAGMARSRSSMSLLRQGPSLIVALLLPVLLVATAIVASVMSLPVFAGALAATCVAVLAVVVIAGRRAALAAAELDELRAELGLAHASALRDTVGVAHDLRGPLTTIAACLDLLAEGALGALTPEAHDATQRAAKASARVRSLVDGMLLAEVRTAIARPLDAAVERAEPDVDLRALLQDVTDALAAEIQGCGAEITVEPMPRVRGD